MLIQCHMLQSMPPGNLNRDDAGRPKHALFGGVTRGRISSQCLKRNIRLNGLFQEALGERRADRTVYLPELVLGHLRTLDPTLDEAEQDAIAAGIAKRFQGEGKSEDSEEDGKPAGRRTPQLVFFPEFFAKSFAERLLDLRQELPRVCQGFCGAKLKPALTNEEKKALKQFEKTISEASKSAITPDIALFGRMTTSDLLVNVEASCQVAHALSTHETIIESDYFTAMDDRRRDFTEGQVGGGGAGFVSSADARTFFNASLYYKYLNVDVEHLKGNLADAGEIDLGAVLGALVEAAALATPSGKQNSFAAHGHPELILVEFLPKKRPMSYANAFLQPVEGGVGRNLMTESAQALGGYMAATADAFMPAGTERLALMVGAAQPAKDAFPEGIAQAETLDSLAEMVRARVSS